MTTDNIISQEPIIQSSKLRENYSPQTSLENANNLELPLITIVTPSYNQGQFLAETIDSVLSPKYPKLEYIVIDGASTDSSLEVIKKYQQDIAYWVSETDRGQAHAINKGLAKAKGSIVAFLNSDDLYLPETLLFVAKFFTENPEVDFLCGQTQFIDRNSTPTQGFSDLFDVEINELTMTETCHIAQPSTFFRSRILESVPSFDESLHYCFDYDFWLRSFLCGYKFASTSKILSYFRLHDQSKTNTAYLQGKFDRDFIQIYQSNLQRKDLTKNQRQGLRRGLAIASSLLFIHLEASQSTNQGRAQLYKIIKQEPAILLSRLIWKTLIVSLMPNVLRQTWQKIKQR